MSLANPISAAGKMLAYTRQLVADSLYWQALVATPESTMDELAALVADVENNPFDRNAALNAIALRTFPTDDQNDNNVMPFPRCLVRKLTDGVKERTSSSGFTTNNSIILVFQWDVPAQWRNRGLDSHNEEGVDAEDKIDMILQEMGAVIVAGTANRTQVDKFTLGPQGLVFPDEVSGETGWLEQAEIHCKIMGYC